MEKSPSPQPTKCDLQMAIRWLIRSDMPDVLRIETASFDCPWTGDEFVECLRQRNSIAKVMERDQKIVAYVVYQLHESHIEILDLAVDTSCRRSGAGTAMVDQLLDKLSHQRRTALKVTVRERALPAQQFFRSMGFRAIEVLRDHWEGEDGYVMQYALESGGSPLGSADDLQ